MPNSQQLIRIAISKEYLNFSAGHFTLFSATERENLHGHNFQVQAAVTTTIDANGLAFDYVLLKRALKSLCDQLDERVLLPQHSPYLRLEQRDELLIAHFAHEQIPFLHRDVLVLPLRNVTIEELSALLLTRLREHPDLIGRDLRSIELGVSSGLGQWAFSSWEQTA